MTVALLIISVSLLFATVLIFSIMLALRSSAAFRVAVERASHSRDVIALVGEPVRAGFFVRGGLRGGGRLASLHATLRGPCGDGRLEIRCVRLGEELRFDVLKFHSKGKVVDLSRTNAA
ncbi:MAG TPA: cytochrome c oxidase assembly factor Coa1 family protein [Pyrinomonadaceae bacterium]|jgi:hypothetical protein